MVNANDTWHATKNVAKELKKVCSGPQYQHGKTWHGELTDKSASIKTHAYYAIKNCCGSAEKLRANLDNIIPHYQNIHSECSEESRCRTDPNYIPSKVQLTDKVALKLLEGAIKNLQIYKSPSDYCSCIDTHYVECFNNACLIYHDKRIVYSDKEYKRRTAMAILDWNENIDREFTSITYTEDARNPRRRTGKNNWNPKLATFVFIFYIKFWISYIPMNKVIVSFHAYLFCISRRILKHVLYISCMLFMWVICVIFRIAERYTLRPSFSR